MHTRALFDLRLKPSLIQGAGKGLVTTKAINKNKNIAKYTGDIKTIADYNDNKSGYAVSIPKHRVVDAASTQSGLARYANDCRAHNQRAGQCNGSNARFVVNTVAGNTTIWLRSTKHIPAHSEIYVSYGIDYWRS